MTKVKMIKMLKTQKVYRELLLRSLSGESVVKQQELAERCNVSIGLVNKVVRKVEAAKAVEATKRGVRVLSPARVLNLWATERNLSQDVWLSFRLDPLGEVERRLPHGAMVTAFSAWSSLVGRRPAEYHSLYFYVHERDRDEFERWLGFRRGKIRKVNPNVFVLGTDDDHLFSTSSGGKVCVPQIYVDIYSVGGPEAAPYLRDIVRTYPILSLW